MKLARTDLERSRGWMRQATDGLWRSFLAAAEAHHAEDPDAELEARLLAQQFDVALTLAVLRYCMALRAA